MTTFQFPIRKADGSQFQDAEQLHKLLEKKSAGHYLLSNSGYWHGGIHISDESAPQCVFNEPVRCIADGEVVAYRLDKQYQTSHVDPGLDAPWLKYSTSFCLIRHKYLSAPNPEEGPNFGKQNELTFYSLYMHLLPFEEYKHEHPTQRFKVISGDWPARNLPKGEPGSKILGNIPKDVVFDVIEGRDTTEGYHFTKGKIVEGQVGSLGVGREVWFASKKDNEPIRNSQGHLRLWDITPQRQKPLYWLGPTSASVKNPDGMVLYRAPEDGKFGTRVESRISLPENHRFRFDGEKAIPIDCGNGDIRRAAPCTTDYSYIHAGRVAVPGDFWAFIDDQTIRYPTSEPIQLDAVVVPKAPIPIQAGDTVGFLGLYETPEGASGLSSRHQVHLEVFTCDPKLDAFLDNQAGLKQGKQYLEVLGLQPAIVGRARETTHPTFLFKDHVFDLKKLPITRDDSGKECYKITAQERARTPGAPLQTLDAYVTKQSVLEANSGVRIISQHDLRAIGFKVVEQHQRDSCSPLGDEQVCHFYRQLNNLADRNSDGKVTPDELRETLTNPEFRDRWSKLVVRHHTEWQSKSDAACLQPFRDRMSDDHELLRHECERIDRLVFWDEVAEKVGLPVDGRVSYFHPVEFIGALNADLIDEDSLDWLIVPNGQLTFDAEGNDIDDPRSRLHTYFSRKVHWPEGASGITIGRGYDLGQRPNPEDDFAMAGIAEPLLNWLLGAKGLKGQAAKNYLIGASDEIKHTTISRKQQYDLFTPIYEDMKNRVIRISRKVELVEAYGPLDWDITQRKIQDVTVDLIYRGDYTGVSRKNIQQSIVNNDLATFSEVVSDRSLWPNVPLDRFNRRTQFLR